MKKEWKNCYLKMEENTLLIGNNLIERKYECKDNTLRNIWLWDKKNNRRWENREGYSEKQCIFSDFPYEKSHCNITFSLCSEDKLSEGKLKAIFQWETGKKGIILEISISENSPFITFQYQIKGELKNESCYLDKIDISPCELSIKSAALNTVTDYDCNTVTENEYLVLTSKSISGNVFLFNDLEEDSCICIVKESPSMSDSVEKSAGTVTVERDRLIGIMAPDLEALVREKQEYTHLYGYTVGVGKKGTVLVDYKKYYKKNCKSISSLYIMSNTWGDCNNDKVISEQLLKNEIETGKKLDIDVIQLDDGWQTGTTMNSSVKKSNLWGSGYYGVGFDFWELNKKKFPDGLRAFDNTSIEAGLWFSPDLEDNYKNWEKDVLTIVELYRKYGVKYFKLDGIRLENKITENHLLKMIEAVYEKTKGKVTFNFDITNGRRLGYFYYKEYGNLFLENRYTDWGTYYPHLTLRSVWQLSEYIPTQKLQIEVLNNKRNQEKYATVLAPCHYDIEYLFAIAMVGNPLMWMEMNQLFKEDIASLAALIAVYRKERQEIAKCIVNRAGQEPNGFSFTGFELDGEEVAYYLLFREMTEEVSYTYNLPFRPLKKIYSNADCKWENNCGRLKMTFSKKAGFVLLKTLKDFEESNFREGEESMK